MDLMSFIPNSLLLSNIQPVPNLEHVCKVSTREDPLKKIIPGTTIWSRIRRWWLKIRLVWPKHPLVEWSLKSTRAIDYEILRQLDFYPYMIHPLSIFRIYWEIIMLLFTIFVLMITPIFLTFYFDELNKWYIYNFFIDVALLSDVILRFFIGYYDFPTQSIIMEPSYVRSKYLRGFFIPDLLPILPLEFLGVIVESLWYFTLLNWLKILRIWKIISYLYRFSYIFKFDLHWYKTLEMFLVVVICIHWSACISYYLPLLVTKLVGENDESWIRTPYMEKRKTGGTIYIACLGRSIISLMASEHYLNVKTTEDILNNIICLFFGWSGFLYLLMQNIELTTMIHVTSKRHLKLIQQLQEYIKYKELSLSLQNQLINYYHFRNKKGFETDKLIIDHVSAYLREKFLLEKYQQIKDMELFKYVPELVLTQLVSVVHSELFMINDVLVTADTIGDGLYYIAYGAMAVYNNIGKELCHLEDGAYFGVLSLVIEDIPWRVRIVAVEDSEVYILSRLNFQRVLASYPDILSHLHDVAFEHTEKTPPLENICKNAGDSLLSMSEGVNISGIKLTKRKRRTA